MSIKEGIAINDHRCRFVYKIYRMEVAVAAEHIQSMHGEYRFPHLLKLLDKQTKEARL
ncbi:hypothetical protein [Paenibacillus etheri]|uniref:hypothetical protein n=1 Tax=Paenibacillus etheri TaxID=1306852 RepID=UPI000A538811|nr:hypothetical protein [Paenibacillus etheri]